MKRIIAFKTFTHILSLIFVFISTIVFNSQYISNMYFNLFILAFTLIFTEIVCQIIIKWNRDKF
jgi:hypothetical protein